MFQPVYLDHNATTPVAPAVLEAMLPYFAQQHGNASSRHEYGRAARRAIDEARQQTLAPFVRRHYERVIVTTDPLNQPSLRVIQKLGAEFIDEVDVPPDDPAYQSGARRKLRFEWIP